MAITMVYGADSILEPVLYSPPCFTDFFFVECHFFERNKRQNALTSRNCSIQPTLPLIPFCVKVAIWRQNGFFARFASLSNHHER